MPLEKIKKILIVGIFITIISSGVQVFSKNTQELSLTFFTLSLIGQCIFALGLYHIDKIAKSPLSMHYISIVCMQFGIFIMGKIDVLNNQIAILILSLLLLFVMLRYLQIFTKVSGQIAFVHSFYLLIFCILSGLCLLKLDRFIDSSSIVSFVIGFMILPPLIYYIIAVLDLKEIRIYSP